MAFARSVSAMERALIERDAISPVLFCFSGENAQNRWVSGRIRRNYLSMMTIFGRDSQYIQRLEAKQDLERLVYVLWTWDSILEISTLS